MTAQASPPGWPPELPPPGTEEFAERVVPWLLDLAPPEFRGHPVLRKHPRVLGWAVDRYLEGEVQALRGAYAQARATFHDQLDAMAIEEVLVALELEGVRLTKSVRQVGLVNDALAGLQWRRRL